MKWPILGSAFYFVWDPGKFDPALIRMILLAKVQTFSLFGCLEKEYNL